MATEGGAARGALIRGLFGIVAAIPLGAGHRTGADHWLEARANKLLPDAWLQATTRF